MPTLGQVSRHKAKQHRQLLMLMTILTQAFFALVRGHLVSLMLLSVWHNCVIINLLLNVILLLFGSYFLIFTSCTASLNSAPGLNTGTQCAGT